MKKEKNKLRWRVVLFIMFSAIFFDWVDFKSGLFGGFYELKDMNQFYTSRKSLLQYRLRHDLQSEIKEI